MPKSFLKFVSLPMLLLLVTSTAHAITIGGATYDEVLSFEMNSEGLKSGRHIGYWRGMRKFYTYARPGVDVSRSVLPGDGANAFDSFYLEGMTATATEDSPLASAAFTFFGDDGSTLLTGSYVGEGFFDLTRGAGANGNFDVTGIFAVTGGSLRDIFGSTIYAEFLFNYLGSNSTKDYYGSLGQVRIYTSTTGEPPVSEVPEPASLVLLASGLLALKRRSLSTVTQ